jgi:hypothetical protein
MSIRVGAVVACVVRTVCRGSLVGLLAFALPALAAAAEPGPVDVRGAEDRVEVARGDLRLVFDKSGRGLASSVEYRGSVVGRPNPASGLFASLIVADGDTQPLQPIRGRSIRAEIAVTAVAVDRDGNEAEVNISGIASFPGIGEATFRVSSRTPAVGAAMIASAELDLPAAAWPHDLESFGLAVPLDLNFHPNSVMNSRVDRETAAAAILPRFGTPVPEVRWLVAEQDETSVWGPMLWTLAGVRQITPGSMQVWQAWGPSNPMFVLQHHESHPGWMAVADGRMVVAAAMPGIERVAPAEMFVDSRARVLNICFQSPYCRPLNLDAHRLGASPIFSRTLRAGPVYVFFEAAEPGTRKPEQYRGPEGRPTLTALGEQVARLPPTQSNFSSRTLVEPVLRPDPVLVPADPDFASNEPSPPEQVDLWIDNPHGTDLDAMPVTRGVPLARGVLRDATNGLLRDEAGNMVPCAARALAFWPDGSIKWLLLDFQARLKAGSGAKYRLTLDRQPPAPPAPPRLSVTESPGMVAVDTGKLHASFASQNGRLSMTLRLDVDGDGRADDRETIVGPTGDLFGCLFSHVDDSASYRSGSWTDPGRLDPDVAEITELRVEEESPLRAVVLIRANLKHELLASTIPAQHRPPTGTPVALRLHFYAGSSEVRLQHTFMFAGDVRHDFLRQIGVCLPIPRETDRQVRTSLDGVPVDLAPAGECGVLQENPDSAFAWRTSGGTAEIAALGRAADGWIDVRGPRWGVTVGLRRMREMFPQEIHLDDRGIWTHFHSPRVTPMDVRRYAFKYGDGESTSTGFGSAFGAKRTHEAVWCFHAANAPPEEGPERVRAMLDPPLARVRPRYAADTLAVGHVAELGSAANDPHFDAVLLHMPRMHQHNREFWRWFGFWDFGDEQQVFDAGRQRWEQDSGRYGWYNNEPLRDYNYHLAYLMTGNRRIWEQAEAMSYHVLEVDVRHASPQPFASASPTLAGQNYNHSTTSGIGLNGRRHNCQHWADGYFGPRVGAPPGFRLAYYQTGDPVLREYLDGLIAASLATRQSQYMGADGDEAILWAMIAGYEMTRDPKYLERIKGYVGLQVDFAAKNGGIPAAQANWDWAENAARGEAKDARDDLWIWSFGGHLAMIEAADALADPAVDQMLCNWLLTLEGFGPDNKRRASWSNNMAACPLLAYYFRRTADPRAQDWFAQRAKGFHSHIPQEAPRQDLTIAHMRRELPAYTPNDGYGWVYATSGFWYVGIPAWQGALRAQEQGEKK